MRKRNSPAIARLDADLDQRIGRAVHRGQKVYGARRIIAARRETVTEMLRAEVGMISTPTPPGVITHTVNANYGRIACFAVAAAAVIALIVFGIDPFSAEGLVIDGAGAVTLAAGAGRI